MALSLIRPNRVEIVSSIQRHRRCTQERKPEIFKHTNEKGRSFSLLARGLDPVIQYRRYIQVTDRLFLNTVGGK